MKRIFIVTCMLTFAFMISAQGGQGGGQGGGQRQGGFQQTPEQQAEYLNRMKTDLKLNDKQFTEFKKIYEETLKKQAALREKYQGGDREKMLEERTKLTTEQNAKYKAALTADQYKKLEELQAAQRQRMGQGGGGGGQRQN